MKRRAVFLIISCFFLTGFDFQPLHKTSESLYRKKVRMYFYLSKPNIYVDEQTGRIQGAFYDYMQVMAEEMGIEIEWTASYTAIPRMIFILQKTPDTAIFGLSKTNARAELVDYTEKPFLMDKPCLIVMKDNNLEVIKSVKNILHMKIGYVNNAFLPDFMKDDRIQFDLISSPSYHKINLQKLVVNRIDAVFSPATTPVLFYINELKIIDQVKILPLPEKPSEYYVVFSKKSPDLVEKYNSAFKKIDGQKTYQDKLANYIIQFHKKGGRE